MCVCVCVCVCVCAAAKPEDISCKNKVQYTGGEVTILVMRGEKSNESAYCCCPVGQATTGRCQKTCRNSSGQTWRPGRS